MTRSFVLLALTLAACGETPPALDCGPPDGGPPDAYVYVPPDGGPADPVDFPAIGPLSGAGDSFRFGVSAAATQIEDMNPATDWWALTAPTDMGGLGQGVFVGDAVRGCSRALEDVALLEELNVDSYRFSMEWARIEPMRDAIASASSGTWSRESLHQRDSN